MKISLIVAAAFFLNMLFQSPAGIDAAFVLRRFIKFCKIIIRKIFRSSPVPSLIGGFILTVFVVVSAFTVSFVILSFLYAVNVYAGAIAEIVICFHIFCLKSRKDAAMKVYAYLCDHSIDSAAAYLSEMTNRDTQGLGESDIIRGTVGATARDTNRKVIAPMFYMLIGGASLGMLYKAADILDHTIGYKTRRYAYFGRFAALLDDILNIIPARITGALYVVASFLSGLDYKNAYKILIRDRWNYSSPNSGYPEAAAAGALNLRLGGGVSFAGEYEEREYIGDDNKTPDVEDIPKSCMLMTIACVLGLFTLIAMKISLMAVLNG